MSRFVPVPAAAIRERLRAAGFQLVESAVGLEEVYERGHDKNPHYTVRVYSSVSHGSDDVRPSGSDAIRVVALFTEDRFRFPPQQYPFFKATRVHRTGSVEAVLDRMIERAREAYAACNEDRKKRMAAELERRERESLSRQGR